MPTDTLADTDAACRLVVWRRSVPGPCDVCGSYAQPLYFPLIRVGLDAYRLAPQPRIRCAAHLPEGAFDA